MPPAESALPDNRPSSSRSFPETDAPPELAVASEIEALLSDVLVRRLKTDEAEKAR
jgi:hypothetical protein